LIKKLQILRARVYNKLETLKPKEPMKVKGFRPEPFMAIWEKRKTND
jgi:hypothetical protein